MALVQSGGLAVYGRFLHCPLFRAICGGMAAKVQKSRPGQATKTAGRFGYRVRLGGRKSVTGQVRLSPSPWPVAPALVSRKRQGYPNSDRAAKRMLTGLQRGVGAGLPHLARAVFVAISGNGAAVAAFGESCRDSGHDFLSLFDPLRTSIVHRSGRRVEALHSATITGGARSSEWKVYAEHVRE
jgi:hypothetical protein